MSEARKLILYISCSLDGYIADENNGLDFLSAMEKPGEDYGYQAFTETVDTILIGRKTYEKVLSMGYEYPHFDAQAYVITRTPRPDSDKARFYTGSVPELVRTLKSQPGKNIYCDGGAELVHSLLREGQIDEIILSVIPTLLGAGISLFKTGRTTQQLELLSSTSFEKGLVQLHYRVLPIVGN